MKQQKNLDSIFFPLSRIIIIIPIVVLLVALYFKISENKTLSYNKSPVATPTTVLQVQSEPSMPVKKNSVDNSLNLDLTGPYQCEDTQASHSAKLYIKNKNIYASIVENQQRQDFLLKGDCIYRWSGYKGEKSCGISEYVGLYETLSAVGFMSFDTLFEKGMEMGGMSASSEASLKRTINSCKKQIVADSIFTYPSNVVFKEGDLLR